ncbi:hypothetical protein N8389_06900 [Flavobacteriaceae bacterium]|nr:hypothetical protein [Flavobacteriaceae bacterium]
MIDSGSFRDPSGYIFYENNKVYRVINKSYKKHYDHLIKSGLYERLTSENLLIKHIEVEKKNNNKEYYKTLDVVKIPYISYPYEWSFSQFKDSLLLTLKIQLICIEYNMTLKDSTPFNVQFIGNQAIFIDTLSFEIIENKNYVWKPYKQFCEMFLGPLCLMSYVDPNLNKLLTNQINGIPLNLINKLLPLKSKFNASVFIHIVLHGLLKEKKHNKGKIKNQKALISKSKHLNIIRQIEGFVMDMKLPSFGSEWGGYNEETISEKKGYVIDKVDTVRSFLEEKKYSLTWDIGSNDGFFSRIISEKYSDNVISFDIDWRCVDSNYSKCKSYNIKNVFPLILDLSNPTPSIGWMNKERSSVYQRFGTPDLITCFAIIHHIINVGIPLENFIEFLEKTKKDILIEYVPISDPKCQIIFESRGEDFKYPTEKEFVKTLEKKFKILNSKTLLETKRVLFLIKKIG